MKSFASGFSDGCDPITTLLVSSLCTIDAASSKNGSSARSKICDLMASSRDLLRTGKCLVLPFFLNFDEIGSRGLINPKFIILLLRAVVSLILFFLSQVGSSDKLSTLHSNSMHRLVMYQPHLVMLCKVSSLVFASTQPNTFILGGALSNQMVCTLVNITGPTR